MKNKSEIIEECWDEGSKESKEILSKHRLLIDSFACNCMTELEKSIVEWLKEEIKTLSPKHKPRVKWGRNCYCTACVKIREIEKKIDLIHDSHNKAR